eukprot:1306871-Alexandrium_andersonii.AAC.1
MQAEQCLVPGSSASSAQPCTPASGDPVPPTGATGANAPAGRAAGISSTSQRINKSLVLDCLDAD